MQRRSPRLIDDIRLIRKIKALSATIAAGTIAIGVIVVFWRESDALRREGNAHIANVVCENRWILESNSESVSEMASDLRSLLARIDEIPEEPRSVSRTVIIFLAATRKGECESEAMVSAHEYELAVKKYNDEVKRLQDNKQAIDNLISRLDDVSRSMATTQFAEASKELFDKVATFRRICNQRFIFRFVYNGAINRLSTAVAKARSLLSDSAFSDFVKLSSHHNEILKGLKKRIGDIAADERAVQAIEAKLRKMPFAAHNVERMWHDQMSASTNAVIESSRVALQRLAAYSAASAKAIADARIVIRQARKEVDVLREKHPGCMDASDLATMNGHEARANELQTDMDDVITSCKESIDENSKKAIRKIEDLNQGAMELLRGKFCDEQKWIVLLDKVGSIATSDSVSQLELAKERLDRIGKEAIGLETDVAREVVMIKSLSHDKWSMRMEKLYDAQLANHSKVMGMISDAATRLGENSTLIRGAHTELSKQLDIFTDRANMVLLELRGLKDALPEDATMVERFKSKLAVIEGKTSQIRESLNAWSRRLGEEIARAKPSIRLVAKLNGIEKHAAVTRGIKGSGWKTPIDGIKSEVGKRTSFAVELIENGVKYVGKKEHIVRAGSQTVVIELSPEFTLSNDINFCGECGKSLEKHRHERQCPYCHSYLEE